jgi:putative inorganic carbon (hco3(-)) transporter
MFNLILVLSLFLPFQIALNPTQGVDLASVRVFILLLFFFWLAKGLKNKRIIIKNSLISALIASFLFLNLASLAVSRNTDWSLRKIMFVFSIFPIYFVVTSVIGSKEKMEKVIQFLIWSGVAVVLMGIIQFFLQFAVGLEKTYDFWARYVIVPFLGKTFSGVVLENPSWLVNISGETYLRATSVFPDPHMLSFYLGLLIPLSLGTALKLKKPLYIVFFAILFLGDILTFSRGGYLGILAGLMAVFLVLLGRVGVKYKAISIAVVVLAAGTLLIPGPISSRLTSSLDLKEGSNAGRLEMWKKAYVVSLDNPFLGVGIGNYPLEVKPSADYREPIYAHNTHLDISAETGILNSIVWILIILASMRSFFKKSKKDSLFFWLAVSLVVFSVHSIFETAIYSPVVLTLLLIIIGFANIEIKNGKAI